MNIVPQMKQTPPPGSSIVLHKGDRIEFILLLPASVTQAGDGWIRTNIGNAKIRRREIVEHSEHGLPILDRDWHDIPMRKVDDRRYSAAVPLLEVGRFEAKTFFLPEKSAEPLWPEGDNVIIKVEPAEYCCSNTIYTAFVRQFGSNRDRGPVSGEEARAVQVLEESGYAVIPLSGTFRDLIRELDFIVGKLRFRIIQLLPIHPTPTTYARMGHFGSPYAALDFKDVDPALAEFDRRTTPMDQFEELVDAVHARNARLFLDIPVNHTGWASQLQIEHPDWFDRGADMKFQSPGAWGVTWADLAKLDYEKRELWAYMAEVLLFWSRHGVDGFRCDAGYMIPCQAWEYIVAKVRCEYPDTIFLLEGLGGKLETVNKLLLDANMNWAYSELFQNYDRAQIESYLPEAVRVSSKRGLLVHYAETHDNNRLASRSHCYARMRTALSALCSQEGAFGITNGVEWFAEEKIDVHGATSLNWGNKDNQVQHIARLSAILEVNPAFHTGAELRLVHQGNENCIALLRQDPELGAKLLVLANLDERQSRICWKEEDFAAAGKILYDLMTGRKIAVEGCGGMVRCPLSAGEVLCLSPRASDVKMVEEILRRPTVLSERNERQRLRAKVLEVYSFYKNDTDLSRADMDLKIREMLNDPSSFCADAAGSEVAPLAVWEWPKDLKRVVMVPPSYFLCVKCRYGFLAELYDEKRVFQHETSIQQDADSHFALFAPLEEPETPRRRILSLTVLDSGTCRHAQAPILFLSAWQNATVQTSFNAGEAIERESYALCTNDRGGMTQVHGAWGEINSQYDAMLAGNLNQDYPVDRRVMLTRCRAWLVYQGYSQAIDRSYLDAFSTTEDGCVTWRFVVSAGQGKMVPLEFNLKMFRKGNSIQIRFLRNKASSGSDYIGNNRPIKLILRPDIEDRTNHEKTKAYTGPETSWRYATRQAESGFLFAPSKDHQLRVLISHGAFVLEPEWTYSVAHQVDAERGINPCSDLFSPGYFAMTLKGGESATLRAEILAQGQQEKLESGAAEPRKAKGKRCLRLDEAMRNAMRHFIVKRGTLKTVIAGYPWFLDWGRDTLICLRGIMAAGMLEEAREILKQFGRFESRGTLPNMICGDIDANRDTSDAPLWFCVACADLVRKDGNNRFLKSDCGGRTIRQVLDSIASHYMNGTPNGVGMDSESGLVFSPPHFTWMDTNYPAATPREGYPIEIQALWHATLSLFAELEPNGRWRVLAEQVRKSIRQYFVIRTDSTGSEQAIPASEPCGWLSDCLHADRSGGAKKAVADDALRPNQLLAITLGALTDTSLRSSILAACAELLVPGAIRSLADRPVSVGLPVKLHGKLLNDPQHPYWGRYLGDEDTRRKPAYHNGTAWTWLFPSYSEALFMTYGEPVRDTALAILSSSVELINRDCIGQVPEITDGDSPHTSRGCGAQAWGVTELYRVLTSLTAKS